MRSAPLVQARRISGDQWCWPLCPEGLQFPPELPPPCES